MTIEYRTLTLLVCGALATLAACRNDQLTQAGTRPEQLIVGRWRWTKSTHCSRGGSTVTTPGTEGHTMQRTFLADGTTNLYIGDTLARTSRYRIRRGLNDLDSARGDTTLVLELSNESQAMLSITRDSLVLGHCYFDGADEEYARASY
jgi:hypothetical protein